ncbi:MAG: hypothetical protein QOJ98_3124 [Acidobacteriota bacterium]|jgi:hypothetical protein|nr:hypothetical protein [Acidobacteriota bacterium]
MSELVQAVTHSTLATVVVAVTSVLGTLEVVVLSSKLVRFVATEVRAKYRREREEWHRFFGGG